jgi:hypothetical protein
MIRDAKVYAISVEDLFIWNIQQQKSRYTKRLEYSRRKGENRAKKTPRADNLGKEEQEVHR